MKLRNLLLILPIAFLVSCGEINTTTPASESTASTALSLTKGLEDCKLFEFDDVVGTNRPLKIVRCSNSTVSTTETIPSGKTTKQRTVVTIDGINYAPIEPDNLDLPK